MPFSAWGVFYLSNNYIREIVYLLRKKKLVEFFFRIIKEKTQRKPGLAQSRSMSVWHNGYESANNCWCFPEWVHPSTRIMWRTGISAHNGVAFEFWTSREIDKTSWLQWFSTCSDWVKVISWPHSLRGGETSRGVSQPELHIYSLS